MNDLSKFSSRVAVAAMLGFAFYAAMGCTIVRYVDDDDGTTDGPPPAVVDMLVLVDLDRGAANLTPDYGNVLGSLLFGLAEQNVQVRKAALAPLYRRAEGAVPLLYGEDDPDGEFENFAEAIAFYSYDAGADYLQSESDSDSANLATLGKELDSRAIYHPTTADSSGAAYFTEPGDGFIVVYLTASPRRCSAGATECDVNGVKAANYFTQGADAATWLELPGGGRVPAGKVFHAAIATSEGVDYSTFYDQCSGYANFPAAKLDVMQPSEENEYFGPFIDSVKSGGGHGEFVDLCEAMSLRGEATMVALGAKVRAMF